MAIPSWPAGLPQELVVEGYGQSAADTLLTSQTDKGPGKRRRRTTAGVEPVQGRLLCSGDELESLRAFFRTTLGDGALRFAWADPASGEPCEMRFTQPISWRARGGDLFDVTLQLEILP